MGAGLLFERGRSKWPAKLLPDDPPMLVLVSLWACEEVKSHSPLPVGEPAPFARPRKEGMPSLDVCFFGVFLVSDAQASETKEASCTRSFHDTLLRLSVRTFPSGTSGIYSAGVKIRSFLLRSPFGSSPLPHQNSPTGKERLLCSSPSLSRIITNVQVNMPGGKHDARKGSAGKSHERQAKAPGSPPPSRFPTHTSIAFVRRHPPIRFFHAGASARLLNSLLLVYLVLVRGSAGRLPSLDWSGRAVALLMAL